MQIVRAAVAVVATVVRAIGGFKVGSIAVGQILLKTGTAMALNALRARLSGQRDYAAAKQAQITELTLGEGPRELIVGRAVTGGQLMDGFNYSVNNDQEALVIALADHECDALEGFWLNDNYITFTGDGTVSGYSDSNGAALQVYFRSGTRTQTPPSVITSNSGGRWTSNDRLVGVAYVVVIYRAAPEFFPAGKPRFRWVLRGAKLYDPRKDSTVSGGSGSHRWDTVSTHEWSENAYLAYYNWKRGVRAQGYDSAGNANLQVMVGPARSADEAPPAEAIAKINICDEDVALKAGGTEKRYRVGGVIQSTEQWIRTEEEFAAAMAGELIDAAGAVAIAPGASSSTQFEIVADDFVIGERIDRQDKRGRNDLYNRVETTYQSLTHAGAMISAPTRVDASARTADGEDRDLVLALRLVTSHTQAQRCSQIALRAARMQRALTVPLGPKFCLIEPGDWGTVTSARHTAGATRTFVVDRAEHGAAISRLALRETAASVFAWTPATDEIDPGTVAPTASTPIGAATISSFDAVALTLTGADGAQLPAIKVTWTAITDLTVKSVQIEVRKTGTTDTVVMLQDRPSLGELIITEGVISGAAMQVRGVCRTEPRRAETATGWVNVTAPTLGAASAASVLWSGVSGSGRPADNATVGARAGANIYRTDGNTVLSQAEIRTAEGTAAAIAGQGWGATASEAQASNAAVPLGANVVRDAGHSAGTRYREAFYYSVPGIPTLSVVTDSNFGRNLVLSTPAIATAAGFDHYHGIGFQRSSAAERPGLGAAARAAVACQVTIPAPGDWVRVFLRVMHYNAAGTWVASSEFDASLATASAQRVGGFFTPSNGNTYALALWGVLKTGLSAASRIIYAWEPLLAAVPASQTVLPQFSQTLDADPGADITASNTAAAIAGQGALATRNDVGSAQITANAVSLVTAATTAASTPAGAWNVVQSISFTSSAAPVVVTFSLLSLIDADPYGSASHSVRLKRNGSVIYSADPCHYTVGIQSRQIISGTIVDTPSAGTVTYTLEAAISGSSISQNQVSLRTITATELKR